MAADPVRGVGAGEARGGAGGAEITNQPHPPPYFRADAFFSRVQLRARLAVRPRGILEPEGAGGTGAGVGSARGL